MHFHASFDTNLAQRQSFQSVHGNVNLSNVDDETCTHVQSSNLQRETHYLAFESK